MSKKSVRRELKWLYRALLKNEGKTINLNELVGWYDEYTNFRLRALKSDNAPSSLKVALPPINIPKYIQWIKQYMK